MSVVGSETTAGTAKTGWCDVPAAGVMACKDKFAIGSGYISYSREPKYAGTEGPALREISYGLEADTL